MKIQYIRVGDYYIPDLTLNMEEYFRALETYVASHKLNLGDGESVLSLLYEAYGDVNRIDDDQIKADFGELYRLNTHWISSRASNLPKPSSPP